MSLVFAFVDCLSIFVIITVIILLYLTLESRTQLNSHPTDRLSCFSLCISMTCRLLLVANRSNFRIIGSDEGLTLETSAFKLFTVANFHHQLR